MYSKYLYITNVGKPQGHLYWYIIDIHIYISSNMYLLSVKQTQFADCVSQAGMNVWKLLSEGKKKLRMQ